MHVLRTAAVTVLGLLMLLSPALGAQAAARVSDLTSGWVWPLDPEPPVVRGFEPPAQTWAPGHRGVDLAGSALQPVLAMGGGIVTLAGPVAGRGVVVVDHGRLRSTYEPVTASVHVGDLVGPGQVIGLLQSTRSHCAPANCLHLGLKRGSHYLDPLSVLGPRQVRLKPLAGTAQEDARARTGHVPTGPQARAARSGESSPLRVGATAVAVVAAGLSVAGWQRRRPRAPD